MLLGIRNYNKKMMISEGRNAAKGCVFSLAFIVWTILTTTQTVTQRGTEMEVFQMSVACGLVVTYNFFCFQRKPARRSSYISKGRMAEFN